MPMTSNQAAKATRQPVRMTLHRQVGPLTPPRNIRRKISTLVRHWKRRGAPPINGVLGHGLLNKLRRLKAE